MATTQLRSGTAGQRMRHKLKQQIGLGRMALLLILVVSLINQLLLLMKVNFHFRFSASVPYYLNWLALKLGGAASVTPLKVFAVMVTMLVFLAYVACWILSARRRDLLKTALLLYCADSVLLVIFAFALLNNPLSCLIEILVHVVVIVVLYNAYRSAQQLRRMSKKKTKPASRTPKEMPAERYR